VSGRFDFLICNTKRSFLEQNTTNYKLCLDALISFFFLINPFHCKYSISKIIKSTFCFYFLKLSKNRMKVGSRSNNIFLHAKVANVHLIPHRWFHCRVLHSAKLVCHLIKSNWDLSLIRHSTKLPIRAPTLLFFNFFKGRSSFVLYFLGIYVNIYILITYIIPITIGFSCSSIEILPLVYHIRRWRWKT
jgi:hypothetical protein